MSKPKKKSTLARRSYSIYRHACARAQKAGYRVPFGLAELRAEMAQTESCPYCGVPLTVASISVDHATPVSRGGSWGIENTVICCRRCNERKGCLEAAEYVMLLSFLERHFAEVAANDVLRRLRAGGRLRK